MFRGIAVLVVVAVIAVVCFGDQLLHFYHSL